MINAKAKGGNVLKTDLQIAKERFEGYLKGIEGHDHLVKLLRGMNIEFEDDTEESGYLNIKVPRKDGVLRIYQPHNQEKYKVQILNKVDARYSGIPTFEPSGRHSFW